MSELEPYSDDELDQMIAGAYAVEPEAIDQPRLILAALDELKHLPSSRDAREQEFAVRIEMHRDIAKREDPVLIADRDAELDELIEKSQRGERLSMADRVRISQALDNKELETYE
ncbi:hypothetical protein FSW04_17665 [Baekduia soli]|uniref:Uncharacterized protein n=1 Tax=Baekduia soli TaxID=496014 RepID=A0A5B8U7Y5_9ACTN|nr:hypothetical protein [Baekduia soli]QEC49226.1 hypothetical protein FSW04_17665 [Baekduia soli]